MLKLTSSLIGTFTLKAFFIKHDNHTTVISDSNCDAIFPDILILTNDKMLSGNQKQILIYIAGYIARVINRKMTYEKCICF